MRLAALRQRSLDPKTLYFQPLALTASNPKPKSQTLKPKLPSDPKLSDPKKVEPFSTKKDSCQEGQLSRHHSKLRIFPRAGLGSTRGAWGIGFQD